MSGPLIERTGRGYRLMADVRVPRAREEVFAFFSDAGNLAVVTPPSMKFRVMTKGEIVMREGLLIDYRVRVRGIPLRWRSEITV